jgi:hypothetical protein
MNVLAEATNYDELVAAFRSRIAALGTTMETLDEVAGLPLRYSSKLLAPFPIKGFGRISLGPILGALGVKICLVEDAEMLARIKHRLVPRKNTGTRVQAQRSRRYLVFKGNPELARMFRLRQVLQQTPRQRRRIARIAAAARWARAR